MELDINSLLKQYHSMRAQYSSIEETEMNLFNHLSNIVNLDWKDGNSYVFSKIVDTERNETDLFRINIWEKISVIEYIYSRYSTLGKKIRCDLDKKDKVLSALDQAIHNVELVNNTFSSMNLSFGYSEFYTLRTKKQMFNKMQKDLSNIKNDFVMLYKKIDEIEADVAAKIRELELFKTNPIIYSFVGNKEKAVAGNLIENDFQTDLNKYKDSIDEENTKLLKMHEIMNQITESYKSDNISLLQNAISDYKVNIDQIHEKRDICLEILNKVPPLYGLTLERIKETFKEEDII